MTPRGGRALRGAVLAALLAAGLLLLPRGSWAAAVFGLLLAGLAIIGTGSWVIRLLPGRPAPFLQLALSAALGWGILCTVLSLIGFAGLLQPWPVAVLLLLGAVGAPLALGDWFDALGKRSVRYWPLSAWTSLALLAGLSVLLLATLLRPPASYAAQAWAAALPKQWALAGEVWGRPGLHPSLAPSLNLVWRGAGHVLGGARLSALLGFWELALAVLGAAVAVRGVLQKGWAAALLAATLFASLPIVALSTAERSGGVAAAGLGLAAFWAFLQSGSAGLDARFARHWAAVAGLLLGLALACGWGAWPLLPAILVVGAVHRPPGERPAMTLGRMGLAAFVAVLPIFPWLVRSAVITGNPLYPHFWGGAVWDAQAAGALEAAVTLPQQSVWILGLAGAQAVLGPLFLIIVPLAVSAPVIGERAIAAAAAAGILAAGWSLSPPDPGWLLPLLGLMAALAATGAARLRRRLPWTGKAVLATLLLLALWQVVPLLRSMEAARFGLFPRAREVAEARSPRTAYLNEISAVAPEGARILLVGETRALDLDRMALWGTRVDPAPITLLLREARDSGAIQEDLALRAALRRRGVTHLLVSPRGARLLDRSPWHHFREAKGGGWAVLFRHLTEPRQIWGDTSGNALWALRPRPETVGPPPAGEEPGP